MSSKTVKKPKVKVLKRIGRPSNMQGVWSELCNAAKGVENLSEELGKSVRQLRRLARRESPLTGSTKIAAYAVAEKYGLKRALEDWENGAEAGK